MSGKFDSRKDSQSTKFERRPRILVKLSFREFVENPYHGIFSTKYVLNVFSIICKLQVSLRSPKLLSVLKKFADCSFKKVDALKKGVMLLLKFYTIYRIVLVIDLVIAMFLTSATQKD